MSFVNYLFTLGLKVSRPEDRDWAKAMRNEYAHAPSLGFMLGSLWAIGNRRLSRDRYEPAVRLAFGAQAALWTGVKLYAAILFTRRFAGQSDISLGALDYSVLLLVGALYGFIAFAIFTRKWRWIVPALASALALHIAQFIAAMSMRSGFEASALPLTQLRLALTVEDFMVWTSVALACAGMWGLQRKNSCGPREV